MLQGFTLAHGCHSLMSDFMMFEKHVALLCYINKLVYSQKFPQFQPYACINSFCLPFIWYIYRAKYNVFNSCALLLIRLSSYYFSLHY